MLTRRSSFLAAFILLTTAGHAQTVINVNAGQTLTEADLSAGSFMGQPFVLGPGTTFRVNARGTVAPLGGSAGSICWVPRLMF